MAKTEIGKGGRRHKAPLAGAGRVSLLTPEVSKKICDAVRAGAYLNVAARYGGVGSSTLMVWMQRGRAVTNRNSKDAMYLEFLEAVEEAEAQSEVAANLQWRSAWPKDWHAAEKWLQVRYPDRYGANRDPQTANGAFAGVNVTINTANVAQTGLQPNNQRDIPLEALIEANPRLLSATMHLFDEIDAMYGTDSPLSPQNAPISGTDAPLSPDSPESAPISRYYLDSGLTDVIDGTFEPIGPDFEPDDEKQG